MSDIVSPLLQWLNAHPDLAGLVTFTISAGESVAIIGTIVPGSIMMTGLGALAGAGVIPLWSTILWAILGAIVGDGISYWIGHYFKERLPTVWPFRYYPNFLKSGEKFFHRYGSMSVFIGRFVGPVRALVPMVAGMLGMSPLRFTIANVTSAIGWAPAYMMPGILLGAAALELPPDIALHVILVLFMIGLFILLCLWFTYKLSQLIRNRVNFMQNRVWRKMRKSRVLSPITVLLKYHNSDKAHGQLTLAILFILTCGLFVGFAYYVKLVGAPNIMVNEVSFHLFRGLRTDSVDNLMLTLTLLGQKQIMLPVIVAIVAWLIYCKRWRTALHALALGVLASAAVFFAKHMIEVERPWGIFHSPETFSMPSGHTTLAVAVYIGLALLIGSAFRPSRRWPIYLIGVFIAFLVSMSRLYLGAHWFTDVVAAWILSSAVVMLVTISYRRRLTHSINPVSTTLVALVALVLTAGTYNFIRHNDMKADYAVLSWPTETISMSDWWQANDNIPAYRTSLFGFPSQHINIEWLADIEKIRETLVKEGWSKPPLRDLASTLHRITDISSNEYLPLVSPQYLDKKPGLIMTRRLGNNGLLVIRLWDANRNIKETHKPLWVGFVGLVPTSYSWLYKKHSGYVDIDAAIIFTKSADSKEWQSKIAFSHQQGKKGKPIQQKILLVRSSH